MGGIFDTVGGYEVSEHEEVEIHEEYIFVFCVRFR